MTQIPPPPVPGASPSPPPDQDSDEAVWAWHNAYLEHRKRVRAELAAYTAECSRLREQYGPPHGTPSAASAREMMVQVTFEDLMTRPEARIVPADWPPCETAE